MFLGHVPAFDVSDGVGWIAAIGMRTQTAFQKTDERSFSVFRDEDNQRQRSWRLSLQDEFQLSSVFFGRRFWPERREQWRECA